METRRPPELPQPRPFASGLHVRKRFYAFRDYPDRFIMLGRGTRCHIRVDGCYVSRVHAALKLGDNGARFLINRSEMGYTFIDGHPIVEATPLRVGQVIVLGMSPIVATDETGWFPINNVAGITDLCRKAIELCGGQRAAEKWLHRDHSAIRRRIERSENRRQNRGD